MRDGRRPPRTRGLYDPRFEHDACGVGFVVDVAGRRSHSIIERGLQILLHLTHRGACGCDELTGDGAGLLVQIPHELLADEADRLGIALPPPGEYGVGMMFLPRLPEERDDCVALTRAIVAEEGQRLLGWRQVPTDSVDIGEAARKPKPFIAQMFIERGPETPPELFEWKLYVIRKRLENEIAAGDLSQRGVFYVASLSSRTIVYKGLLLPEHLPIFFRDLGDERFVTALALVHQRYSTNTFPSWPLAHPFRFVAHNGEINTLRGNVNWMHARERLLAHPRLGRDLEKVLPICTPSASDSAVFDNVLELLVLAGRSLPEAVSMLIPEPWSGHESMSDEKRAFYEYKACLMEPWDGPAAIAFTDGVSIGAVLDRNGLRPGRYWVTRDGLVVMASETGVLDIPPGDVAHKGRLQPGRMFLVDTAQGRIVEDDEIKQNLARRHPYRAWVDRHQSRLASVVEGAEALGAMRNGESLLSATPPAPPYQRGEMLRWLRAFGYTWEDLRIILAPMAAAGEEPLGSMGNDAPLSVLSDRPQLLYHYFKQLFAQVTNPPLDAIREEIITSMITTLGAEGNLLDETPEQCRLLRLEQPILLDDELAAIASLDQPGLAARTFFTCFPRAEGAAGFARRLDDLRDEVSQAVADGATIVVLSDRDCGPDQAALPALLATAAVHHRLIREATRTRCGLVVESAEPREVHHFALLVGYGACAVNPYLALASLERLQSDGHLPADAPLEKLKKNYVKAAAKGLLKVMSKMGISTLQSYRGAQIFEAIGLAPELIDDCFTWTPSRIAGIGMGEIAAETLRRHEQAWPAREVAGPLDLDVGGAYQWRRTGEAHLFRPDVVAQLQQATRVNSREDFREYCRRIDHQERQLLTLRGLLDFKRDAAPVPLEEIEPASEIVKRFATGAMSFGSISKEAHETLAIAMNRIGGRSNTGEGGEDPARYAPLPNGDSRTSAIKQVASARFGVTSQYLVSARELQIKMAQGAKPGEGGQLPGHKVDREIARIRHSTPGVGLISPPPHHDIYSIEDLAQLIYDLKCSNPRARVSVKLVAEVGVGTVAAGVAKGKADVVLISGHDGGTGASPLTSIKHAGIPWELGLAEAHQVLLINGLRNRIVVQTDGQLRTPRDIAIAAMLGAEEWGIATAALVTLGCIMMRKCHLNTCPVGIATQDPVLRARFEGQPEWVVNFFFLLAEELRVLMAELGFRTLNEMVGRVDRLETRPAIEHWKARGLDYSAILEPQGIPTAGPLHCIQPPDEGFKESLDYRELLAMCEPAFSGERVVVRRTVRNVDRAVGTLLSSEITRRLGPDALLDDTIELHLRGSAGQSLMAFGVRGVSVHVEGDVNDYCGKGLSGGRVIVFPPREASFAADENIIAGNVVLYGATSGEVYLCGLAGERFCVRNSGATAVVEGVGDHGCEYMTGGRAVILGRTGRNFAAGMSGGIAYVFDEDGLFARRVNRAMVELESLDPDDEAFVLDRIRRHVEYTSSQRGRRMFDDWDQYRERFVKVMPIDYRRALQEMASAAAPQREELAVHG